MAFSSLRLDGAKGRFNMISFRELCKSVLNHPFLVLSLLYLICLYRYFPLLFSVLISASPVVVCTALVLGILLINGQPNNLKEECREERSPVGEALNNGVADYTFQADRNGIFSKDRFAEVRNDIVEKGMKMPRALGSGIRASDEVNYSEVNWGYGNSKGSQRSKKDNSKATLQFPNYEYKGVLRYQVHPQNGYEKYGNIADFQHDVGAQDHHDSSMNGHRHDDDADHSHGSSGTESDGEEKSSLDALVADVIPTLQETHPLLEFGGPTQSQAFQDASNDAGVKSEVESIESNDSSEDSGDRTDHKDEEDVKNDEIGDDKTKIAKEDGKQEKRVWANDTQRSIQDLSSEMEKNEQLESLIVRTENEGSTENDVDDDDDGDDDDDEVDEDDYEEEEENADTDKNEGKHVTMWTEEDEKNLRQLGCSELERNLRLENLLARRRAKRNFSMISERNLIDLDLNDLPFQVAPVSTAKANPFDTPKNSNQTPSMPPVPGSAPSVTVPRKNPFDSPCTSPKESHHRTAESHRQESTDMNLNNTVFKENGSSSTGVNSMGHDVRPDFLGMNRKDAVFRRYESFSTGYSFIDDDDNGHDFINVDRRDAIFRRHETFNARTMFPSIFSPNKPVFVTEQAAGEMSHTPLQRQSIKDSESLESALSSNTESSLAPLSHEDVEPYQEIEVPSVLHQDKEVLTKGDHTSSHFETGSESSDVKDSQPDQDEYFAATTEDNVDHQIQEADNVNCEIYDAATSSSLSSEENDDSSSVNKGHTAFEQVEDSGSSPKDSSNTSDINSTSANEDHPSVEPVYDTSPSGAEKETAFSPHSAQM